jgi:hypothetical protein
LKGAGFDVLELAPRFDIPRARILFSVLIKSGYSITTLQSILQGNYLSGIIRIRHGSRRRKVRGVPQTSQWRQCERVGHPPLRLALLLEQRVPQPLKGKRALCLGGVGGFSTKERFVLVGVGKAPRKLGGTLFVLPSVRRAALAGGVIFLFSTRDRVGMRTENSKQGYSSMKKDKLSKQEVAQILEDFLDAKGSRWAWDDFTLGMSFEDKSLEKIRVRSVGLSQEFPPDNPNEFCNERGRNVIRDYVKKLRALDRPAE